MPRASTRPAPPARMVALLAVEKRRLLAEKGHVTRRDFDAAWAACWMVMVLERSWSHNTYNRRSTRAAMLATRSEVRAAFLDEPTAFSSAIGRLSSAASGMCLQLEPEQTMQALLATIAYVETGEGQPDLMAA